VAITKATSRLPRPAQTWKVVAALAKPVRRESVVVLLGGAWAGARRALVAHGWPAGTGVVGVCEGGPPKGVIWRLFLARRCLLFTFCLSSATTPAVRFARSGHQPQPVSLPGGIRSHGACPAESLCHAPRKVVAAACDVPLQVRSKPVSNTSDNEYFGDIARQASRG
jgi:hypothetical protein